MWAVSKIDFEVDFRNPDILREKRKNKVSIGAGRREECVAQSRRCESWRGV